MLRLILFAVLVSASLAPGGCGDAGPAGTSSVDALAQISAETVEAERVCATITGHASVESAPDTSAMNGMRAQEYRDCVKAVAGDQAAAPELRGRMRPDS